MMAFCPEHPKWDQNPKFTTLSEATSIPTLSYAESPPPGFDSPISGEISWELILANYLLTSYNDYPFCIKLTADCVHVL